MRINKSRIAALTDRAPITEADIEAIDIYQLAGEAARAQTIELLPEEDRQRCTDWLKALEQLEIDGRQLRAVLEQLHEASRRVRGEVIVSS